MLRPFLIVGVGGSGGKTVRGLRHALTLRLDQLGWDRGIPKAWQLIHVDTPLAQDGASYPAPFMPATNYTGLVAGRSSYRDIHASIAKGQSLPATVISDVKRMLPDPERVDVDPEIGAGQFRAIGRAIALSRLEDIRKVAVNAINAMNDASALSELASLGTVVGARVDGGAVASPTIIVISSIAGGSGAGQYLDVIEAVKEPIKGQNWSTQVFALLYAPDVFDNIDGVSGMPGNALAAISETMNGFWTRNPSTATRELYSSKRLAPAYGGPRSRVGAAYPIVIGRENSKVSFRNQGEVYSAMATSLAAWMTDDRIQDEITAYVSGNQTANSRPNVLTDNTRLFRPADQAPPFSSLGYGRVTLGRDKFIDYSVERFSRAVLDRILYAHTEEDPRFERQSEDEWIKENKTKALERFIKAAGLDEEADGLGHDDVIDALRPAGKRKQLAAEFRQAVLAKAATNLDKKTGGLDHSTWQNQLITVRNSIINDFIAQETVEVEILTAEWIERVPKHILDRVEMTIAQEGLPVTVAVLEDTIETVRKAELALMKEAESRRGGALPRLESRVSAALSESMNQESIRPEESAVEDALKLITDSYGWVVEANLREAASKLLGELRTDFLAPLRSTLKQGLEALIKAVTEETLPDGRENEYQNWPERVDPVVPAKYTPPPNERLLVPHTEYPQEFQRLVSDSFGKKRFAEAILDAVTAIIQGPTLAIEDDSETAQKGSFIWAAQRWMPSATGNVNRSDNRASSPRFNLATELWDFQERAHAWIIRRGTPFAAYVTEDLNSFFDERTVAPGDLSRRTTLFREAFAAALATSEPLVRLNPTLLSAIHEHSIGQGTRLMVSSIPFPDGTKMHEIAKAALTGANLWDPNVSPGWFRKAQVDSIDVFAWQGFPYQPVVMDSVMTPIVAGWLGDSTGKESRSAFWQWKRARPLREAVPADSEVFDTMVRGWFVARALSQLTVLEHDGQRGPKLAIHHNDEKEFVSFPFPLLYDGIPKPHDQIGAVIESLTIAMVMVNAESSLRPLYAYHALMDLGGSPREASSVLTDWIREGVLPDRAPIPRPDRAGTAAGTLAERQEAIRAFIDKEMSEFKDDVVTQDSKTSVYSYPVSWEIRETVLSALQEIRDLVLFTKAEKSWV